MSINTIKLTEDDVNKRQKLTKLFIEHKITTDQAKELKQILENERYMAMEDGDFQALYSILSWIKAVDDFLIKKVNIFEIVSRGTNYECVRCRMHYTYREDGLCYECRVVEALDRIAYALEGIERK